MTPADLPLPAAGGSYIRDPETGALVPISELGIGDPITAPDAAPDPTPAAPARGRKTPAKEA